MFDCENNDLAKLSCGNLLNILKIYKAFFGAGIESLPEDITLEDLLSGEGFDLRYTNEQRFQKLRQFRRLVGPLLIIMSFNWFLSLHFTLLDFVFGQLT